MKPSIYKGRETPFLLAAAAALFLAACCYLGAALYGVLAALPEARTLPAAAAGDTLHGLAVRQESAVEAVPGARDGERITGEGVYFSACDGRESLSPPDLDGLTPAGLAALLEAAPEPSGGGRIVKSTVWYYAALLDGGDAPEPGRCRLRFEGFSRAVPARLIAVREEDGRQLLLFRLTEGGNYLKIRIINAEIES